MSVEKWRVGARLCGTSHGGMIHEVIHATDFGDSYRSGFVDETELLCSLSGHREIEKNLRDIRSHDLFAGANIRQHAAPECSGGDRGVVAVPRDETPGLTRIDRCAGMQVLIFFQCQVPGDPNSFLDSILKS